MKSVLITFDQAYYERIMALLDRLGCRGFTYLEKVQGRGSKIEKSNKKEGRIYIIYEILPFYLFTCRTSVRSSVQCSIQMHVSPTVRSASPSCAVYPATGQLYCHQLP